MTAQTDRQTERKGGREREIEIAVFFAATMNWFRFARVGLRARHGEGFIKRKGGEEEEPL